MGFWEMKANLDWQLAMGVDEAILEAPIDRFQSNADAEASDQKNAPTQSKENDAGPDPVKLSQLAATSATDLAGLRDALAAYDYCDLKRGARSLVFSDGLPGARVMIIGEAPGRDEDLAGRPFVGRAGQLLDVMFGHVGLSRTASQADEALYITNVLPWRPPQNRDPNPDEVAMMLPFLERHVSLANPDIIVAMGNHATGALLKRTGITRLRGTWAEALDRPVLPMFHPAYLLRNPAAKREAWADLLELRARLSLLRSST